MTVYVAVDFHARQQTISYCDLADGEIHRLELRHQRDDVRAFYAGLSGAVIVGLEASGYSAWFEQMLAELGHTYWLGNPAEIRRKAPRRQKNDRRDADHMVVRSFIMLRDQIDYAEFVRRGVAARVARQPHSLS